MGLFATLVLLPLALAAQEAERVFPVPVAAFADGAPAPISVALPQSSGEKSAATAALLNALLLPGIGNFYAGNSGHGLRHLGLALGGSAVVVVGIGVWNADDDWERGDEIIWTGLAIVAGNWVWSIFSGIEDARAAGRPGRSNGVTSLLQPKLVPLGLPSAVGDTPGVATHRLGLQLLRVTF